jgi:hypothetical protein
MKVVNDFNNGSEYCIMEENVGGTDRLARIVVGAVLGLISLGVLGNMVDAPMWVSPVFGILALALLGTAYTCKCKINDLLGRDSSE